MKNVMEYKGYWAEIKYDDDTGCFYGIIEGLKNDSISFEGDTVKDLREDFESAIDDYINFCKETNTEPEKQCKGSLNVRLGVDLHTKAKIKSLEENVSINELIKNAVELYLKNRV
ncbi:MAG: type II toxin-antitoxin system HicB family antitoxin [Clostridia bacterium]|nr:type II toxin-antitoxin system HicB family antitoxin [Clostridia bacterium]